MYIGLRLVAILDVFFPKWRRILHSLLILVEYMGMVQHTQPLTGELEQMREDIGDMTVLRATN